MKKLYIIHRWEGSPEESLHKWLKVEAEKLGFEVLVPAMPETDEPRVETWVPFLNDLIGTPDESTFFIGHSIGCQAILRYFETLPEGTKIGGAIFIAGWYEVQNLETEDEVRIVKPWLETPRNDDKIKKITDGKTIVILSDNDQWVSLENKALWEERAGAKVVVESGKGHFIEEDGVMSLPSALQALVE